MCQMWENHQAEAIPVPWWGPGQPSWLLRVPIHWLQEIAKYFFKGQIILDKQRILNYSQHFQMSCLRQHVYTKYVLLNRKPKVLWIRKIQSWGGREMRQWWSFLLLGKWRPGCLTQILEGELRANMQGECGDFSQLENVWSEDFFSVTVTWASSHYESYTHTCTCHSQLTVYSFSL